MFVNPMWMLSQCYSPAMAGELFVEYFSTLHCCLLTPDHNRGESTIYPSVTINFPCHTHLLLHGPPCSISPPSDSNSVPSSTPPSCYSYCHPHHPHPHPSHAPPSTSSWPRPHCNASSSYHETAYRAPSSSPRPRCRYPGMMERVIRRTHRVFVPPPGVWTRCRSIRLRGWVAPWSLRGGIRRVTLDVGRRSWILPRRSDDRSGCMVCWVRQSIFICCCHVLYTMEFCARFTVI